MYKNLVHITKPPVSAIENKETIKYNNFSSIIKFDNENIPRVAGKKEPSIITKQQTRPSNFVAIFKITDILH